MLFACLVGGEQEAAKEELAHEVVELQYPIFIINLDYQHDGTS